MNIKRIRLIYGVLLSLITAAAGVCLIAACLNIYGMGDHPFTRESVAAAFSQIAVPIYLCLTFVVGGFILDFVFPPEKTKPSARVQQAVILRRLYSTIDLSGCDKTYRKKIQILRNKREVHSSISIGLLVLGCAIFLSYALSDGSFHSSEITSSIIQAMWILLPCLIVPFLYAIFAFYYSKTSVAKELDLVKQWPDHGGKKREEQAAAPQKNHMDTTVIVRYAVLVVALAILVYGFITGGTADVLTKAVNICTECVGLG